MPIKVALNHVTHYRYDRLVSLSPQVVRLRPAPHSRTPILSYSLKVTPDQHFINWQQDPQSNFLARLVFPEKTREFRVEVDLIAELSVINPFDFFPEPYATKFPFKYEETLREELKPYLETAEATERVRAFVDAIPLTPMGSVDFLVDINRRVQNVVAYGSGKKSKGLMTDNSATRSTSMRNSRVFSGKTNRARKLDCGSCCQLMKCWLGVIFSE